MSEYLLDTNILIRYLRRSPGYIEMMHQSAMDGALFISAITRLEVVRGMRDHERGVTFKLLDSLKTIAVTEKVADLAGELIQSYLVKGISLGVADAIIAATAIHHKLALVTTNARHFPMPELDILQADEDGHIDQITK